MSINLSILCFRAQEKSVDLVAHADDVTIFVTQHADFRVIQDAVRLYEKASGAGLKV